LSLMTQLYLSTLPLMVGLFLHILMTWLSCTKILSI
jgi:hypothetical protein